jgi:spore coat protein CotH
VSLATRSAVAESFKVTISEVHYHPADDTTRTEFIELQNWDMDREADLSGWVLTGGVQFAFPAGTRIPPGEFRVLANNRVRLIERYDLDPSIVLGEFQGDLENQGERIVLFTRGSFVASSVEYRDGAPWPETPDGLGPSLERRSPVLDDSDPEAWAASILVGGTPGRANTRNVENDVPPDAVEEITIIPRDSEWRFFRGTVAPPEGWNDRGFDDGAWERDTAGFGYERGDFTTTLDDMQDNYTSFYVRHGFDVSNANRVDSLTLQVVIDDGFVAYFNGVEVGRYNVDTTPGEPVPNDTLAFPTTRIAETREIDVTPFLDGLADEGNVLAIVAFNGSIGSRDFTIHPSLNAIRAVGGTRRSTVVRAGDEWRFHRGSSAPPESWAEFGFNDDDWERGPGGFGYGDGDDATLLDDMSNGYLSVFIRRAFDVDLDGGPEGDDSVLDLVLDIEYDDGFVAYLNGDEIARSNVAGTAFDDSATTSHEADVTESFTIPAALLRAGRNVIALQGHNFDTSSSDFSLAASLSIRFIIPNDDPDPDPDPEDLQLAPRDLVINEIAPLGAGTGFVELFNPTNSDVDAGGRQIRLEPESRGLFVIPADRTVEAGGFLRFHESSLGFELDEITTLLLTTDGDHFIDALNPRTTSAGRSTGRFPDGATNRFVFDTPTPSEPNEFDAERPVIINEIMFHPTPDGAGGEFIELFNRSTRAVDISGWSFTRGVSFTFGANAEIPGFGFVVIAADPAETESEYDISNVFGPWDGALQNDAENLLIRDTLGNPVDRVRYADEGSWPEDADGTGRSLELIHFNLANRHGPAWRSSDGRPTPGQQNSRHRANPAPIVTGVSHSPVIPTPDDPVRVLATISDNADIARAELLWRIDNDGGDLERVPMRDDGEIDDGIADNGVFGGEIPAGRVRSIVRFWIEAEANDEVTTTAPSSASFLYQVELSTPESTRPTWRIIMRDSDLRDLRGRGNGSDSLLDTTIIARGKAYYNRGIRYRGSSARGCPPLSYRIQFDHDRSLDGIKRININGCNVQRQWIGLDFLRRTGIPTPQGWLRRLSINGSVQPDIYLRVETVDDAFLERTLAPDDNGNLYRGLSQANLDYRGDDFDRYRGNYDKRTNEELDDYSDVVDLCRRFDRDETNNELFPEAIEERVDVAQWSLYFAAFAILGSTENSIVLNNGDDYFLYHRFSDDRWILLPWDLDSCFDDDSQDLFRPSVDSIERFLEHPRYAPDYWCFLEQLLETAFVEEQVNARIDVIAPLFSEGQISQLRRFTQRRRDFILSRLETRLTVEISEGGTSCDGLFVATGDTLSLRGIAPGCGTLRVMVNGTQASYNRLTNAWSVEIDLDDATSIVVSTFDRHDTETNRVTLPVVNVRGDNRLPPDVDTDLTLAAGTDVLIANTTVTIAPGATLRIPAGVTVLFVSDAELLVDGRLLIEGEDEAPVTLRAANCDGEWPGVRFTERSSGSRIAHCQILAAGARNEEAAIVVRGADVSLDNVVIDRAAAVGVDAARDAVLEMVDCDVRTSTDGLKLVQSNATVRDCRFLGQSSTGVNAIGDPQHRISMERTVIANCADAVVLSGALRATVDNVTIRNCPRGIVLNTLSQKLGGAVTQIENSIVWMSDEPIAASRDAEFTVTFTDTDTDGVAVEGEGNISADPLFVDPSAGDYRLTPLSPCIGAARDGADMGALAFAGEKLGQRFVLCDANSDGSNNLTDAVFILAHLFGQQPGPTCAASGDCNSDGQLNLSDAIFDLNHLFNQGPQPAAPYPGCASAAPRDCADGTCLN